MSNELQASAALPPDLIDSNDGYRTTLRNVGFGLNTNAAREDYMEFTELPVSLS
jgi:hypothetical protein